MLPYQPAPDDRNNPPQPAGAAHAEGVTCSLCPSQVLTSFHSLSHRIRGLRSGAERCSIMAYLPKPSAATPAEEHGERQAEPIQPKRMAGLPPCAGPSPASQSGLKGEGRSARMGQNVRLWGIMAQLSMPCPYCISVILLNATRCPGCASRDAHARNDPTASSASEHWHAVCTAMGSAMACCAARRRCFSRKVPPLGLFVPRRLPHRSTLPSMTTEPWRTAKGRKR